MILKTINDLLSKCNWMNSEDEVNEQSVVESSSEETNLRLNKISECSANSGLDSVSSEVGSENWFVSTNGAPDLLTEMLNNLSGFQYTSLFSYTIICIHIIIKYLLPHKVDIKLHILLGVPVSKSINFYLNKWLEINRNASDWWLVINFAVLLVCILGGMVNTSMIANNIDLYIRLYLKLF